MDHFETPKKVLLSYKYQMQSKRDYEDEFDDVKVEYLTGMLDPSREVAKKERKQGAKRRFRNMKIIT